MVFGKKSKTHRQTQSLDSIQKPPPTTPPSATPQRNNSGTNLKFCHRADIPDFNGMSPFREARATIIEALYWEDPEIGGYGNSAGIQMLKDREEFQDFKERVAVLEAEQKKGATRIRKLEADNMDIYRKVEILSVSQEGYSRIRQRFLENFRKDTKKPYHLPTIQEGNVAAHGGDMVTDTLLFRNGARNDTAILREIYGLEYKELLEVVDSANKGMIMAIDKYGTMATTIREEAIGKRLSEPIEAAFIAYVKVQKTNLKADPLQLSPSSAIGCLFHTFLNACGDDPIQ